METQYFLRSKIASDLSIRICYELLLNQPKFSFMIFAISTQKSQTIDIIYYDHLVAPNELVLKLMRQET